MSQPKSREVFLAAKIPDELLARLESLRTAWREDHSKLARGLLCSESKEGRLVVVASEAAFTILPGACVVKSLGAIEISGDGPVIEPGSHSKTLHISQGPSGWSFSIKFVPPKHREEKGHT